jgi:hypothetical protein
MGVRPQAKMDALVLQRVYGEFVEMPGLRLTCQQAQRLWGVDEQTCRGLLDLLVEARFLFRSRDGAYSRGTDELSARTRVRMARPDVDGPASQPDRGTERIPDRPRPGSAA